MIQFYLAFPFLLYIKARLGDNYFVIFTGLLSILYWGAIIILDLAHLRASNSFFLQYLWEFGIAMVLDDHYRKTNYPFWDQKLSLLLLAAGIGIGLMVLIATYGGTVGRMLNDMPAAVGYTALVALTYALIKKVKLFVVIFTYIGSISYEIYLTHVFVAMVLSKMVFHHINIVLSYIQGMFFFLFAIISAIYFKKLSQKIIQYTSQSKIWMNPSFRSGN